MSLETQSCITNNYYLSHSSLDWLSSAGWYFYVSWCWRTLQSFGAFLARMTHLQGWQLMVAASWGLSCGFWSYSHGSLLGILFMWLEFPVWKLGSERGYPKSKISKMKEEASYFFKTWAWEPQNVTYAAFYYLKQSKSYVTFRGGKLNSVSGFERWYMCSRRRGILGLSLETANHSLSSDDKHLCQFHLPTSPKVLSLSSLCPQRLACLRHLFHLHADGAVSRAPIWSDFWALSSISPLAPQLSPCHLRAPSPLRDFSTRVGGPLIWQLRTPKGEHSEDKPYGAAACVIIAPVLLVSASHKAKGPESIWESSIELREMAHLGPPNS